VSTAIVTASVSGRRRGMRPPGLAARAVFCVCQKIASRPFTCVNHELGAGKAATIEHEIDRCSAPAAEQDGGFVDDLGRGRPGCLEAVAVDARGRRPRLARLQHQPASERKQQQVGKLAVSVWVTGDEEGPAAVAHAAAA
jgi:hypothetical protein